jgi:hypothetical protein
MIAASAMAHGSAITRSDGSTRRRLPSSVTISSPFFARRTTILPSPSLEWSKTWSGLPSACIT